MRAYDSETSAHLSARSGLTAQRLVCVKARNQTTGVVEALALCSGLDDLSLTLEGEARHYLAVGGLLEPEPITAGSGLAVRVHQIQMAVVAPEVENLVKGYDTRFAPVEVHRALFAPSGALVGTPHRVFRGMVNSIDFPTVAPGASPSGTLEVVSETRALTRMLATKKSDESHQARGGDRFRRYGDISGVVPVYWGEKRADED